MRKIYIRNIIFGISFGILVVSVFRILIYSVLKIQANMSPVIMLMLSPVLISIFSLIGLVGEYIVSKLISTNNYSSRFAFLVGVSYSTPCLLLLGTSLFIVVALINPLTVHVSKILTSKLVQ